jgi:Ca-activated chloride channel homolog
VPGRPAGSRKPRPRPVAILLLALLTTGATLGGPERGNRLFRAGQYAEAVEAYRSVLGTRRDGPVLRYNLGTALLHLGRYEEAEVHLRSALDALEPGTRTRVQYNLGQRFLEAARRAPDPAAAGPLFDAAVEAYRQALRLAPGDPDTRWNYELALRAREENRSGEGRPRPDDPSDEDGDGGDGAGQGTPDGTPPDGGGGGQGSPGQPRPDRPRPGDAGAQDGPMSPEDAERILNALEQDERQVFQDRLRQGRRDDPTARDW